MNTLRVLVAGGLALALAHIPATASAQGLQLTGYADFEVGLSKVDSDNSELVFDNHHFNIIAQGKLFENMYATAEVEYEHGGEEIALEFGFLTYTGFRNVRISAGKFIVPFGRFNKDLHPTWINKMPDRPNGFKDVFPQTYSDVGIWVSGGVPAGNGVTVTYDAFVVNGLMGDDGGGIRGMRNNDRDKIPGGGIDDNKALGGRFGVVLAPQGFDIGTSIYTGNYVNVADSSLQLTFFGVDAAYHNRGLELRGEAVFADQEATGGDLTKKGGYLQVAYRTKVNFEPVIRFSLRDMPGSSGDSRRVSFGASYYLSPNAAVRLAYHKNFEDSGFSSDNDGLMGQFTVVF